MTAGNVFCSLFRFQLIVLLSRCAHVCVSEETREILAVNVNDVNVTPNVRLIHNGTWSEPMVIYHLHNIDRIILE